jgi:hypothetical protein
LVGNGSRETFKGEKLLKSGSLETLNHVEIYCRFCNDFCDPPTNSTNAYMTRDLDQISTSTPGSVTCDPKGPRFLVGHTSTYVLVHGVLR